MPSPPVSQIQKEADVISKNLPFKIFLDHYPPSPLHRRPKKKDTRSKTDWTTSSWSERCNTAHHGGHTSAGRRRSGGLVCR